MKKCGRLFWLCAFGLSLNGCSASVPKDAFPDMIGKYKLNNVGHVGGMFEAKAWYPAKYATAEGPDSKQIFYGLAVHKNAAAAREDQATNIFCSKKKIAADQASDLSVVKDRKAEIIKEDKLRDKAGQELGELTICREEVKGTLGDLLNNYQYTIVFNHDKRVIVLNGETKSIADKQVPLSELLAFMKALPDTAQVDFASLKLDAVPGAKVTEVASANQVAAMDAPVKLAPAPYLKGKALIVESEQGSGRYYFSTSQTRYGLSEERLASSGDEAQTVIQVVCSKGERIGDYITKDAEKRKIPAYASRCEVRIIDKTIPAVIAQKTFITREVPFYEEERTFTELDREYVISKPFSEIGDFLKSLPTK